MVVVIYYSRERLFCKGIRIFLNLVFKKSMAPSLPQVIKAVFRPILRPTFGQIPTPIKKLWQVLTVNERYSSD
jgi:hypothetical protein